MKLNTLTPYLFGVVLLLIASLVYTCDSKAKWKDKAETLEYEGIRVKETTAVKFREFEARIGRAQGRINAIRVERGKDSLKNAAVVGALKARIQVLVKKASVQLPEIQPILDSLPKLAAYVALKDSIIAGKDSVILATEEQRQDDFNSLTKEIKETVDQLAATEGTSETWRQTALEESKKAQREKKRKKFYRAVAAVALAAITLTILTK